MSAILNTQEKFKFTIQCNELLFAVQCGKMFEFCPVWERRSLKHLYSPIEHFWGTATLKAWSWWALSAYLDKQMFGPETGKVKE